MGVRCQPNNIICKTLLQLPTCTSQAAAMQLRLAVAFTGSILAKYPATCSVWVMTFAFPSSKLLSLPGFFSHLSLALVSFWANYSIFLEGYSLLYSQHMCLINKVGILSPDCLGLLWHFFLLCIFLGFALSLHNQLSSMFCLQLTAKRMERCRRNCCCDI